MGLGSSAGDNDKLETLGVPALHLGNTAPFDEAHASCIHTVAKATVNAVIREAIEDLAQAVTGATEWLADAVRGELISQAATAAEPPNSHPIEEEVEVGELYHPFSPTEPPELDGASTLLNRPPSATIRAVAKATVDMITDEAVNDIVQAVEKATEWIAQAVGNELISQVLQPDESIEFHNATETQAMRSELDTLTVASVVPSSDTSTASEEQQELADTPEVTAALDVPRLSLQVTESSVTCVRALAKATAEAAVWKTLHSVTQATGDASEWLTQAARGELIAQAVVDTSTEDEPYIDNNSTGSKESEQPPPLIEEINAPLQVPALQLPNATDGSPETIAECHELAVPFVNEIVSLALHQVISSSSPEPQDYADDDYEDYTPINTPTAEDALSKAPLSSIRSPEQEAQPTPPVVLSGRATPPDKKPTPRRKSPITSNRGLGTPTSNGNPPSSPPSAMSSSPATDETPTDFSEPEHPHLTTLPPLVLSGVQLTGRTKLHQQKTPRKTPRQSSYQSYASSEAASANESPRAATATSSRLNKHTSRASTSAEPKLSPLSSARTAALIYAQQPSSSRQHHHHHNHKPKKLRDAASQTSPPLSPSLTSLPRQSSLGVHDDSNGSDLPATQVLHSEHSRRELVLPENGVEKKTNASNNALLAPLLKTPVAPPSTDSRTTKASSPPRAHRNHSHGDGHSRKGSGSIPSPNKRSGYCQRCVFEGRTCKINDCLKHQVLK